MYCINTVLDTVLHCIAGDVAEECAALQRLSATYYSIGDFDNSLKYSQQYLELAGQAQVQAPVVVQAPVERTREDILGSL